MPDTVSSALDRPYKVKKMYKWSYVGQAPIM